MRGRKRWGKTTLPTIGSLEKKKQREGKHADGGPHMKNVFPSYVKKKIGGRASRWVKRRKNYLPIILFFMEEYLYNFLNMFFPFFPFFPNKQEKGKF